MNGNQINKKSYSRPSVTVDVVIFAILDEQLKVLLIRRKNPPFQRMWAIPGGFVNMDESLETAAHRELEEETGVTRDDVYLEQLYTFGEPDLDMEPPKSEEASPWCRTRAPAITLNFGLIRYCASSPTRPKLMLPQL